MQTRRDEPSTARHVCFIADGLASVETRGVWRTKTNVEDAQMDADASNDAALSKKIKKSNNKKG
jgi:hypothetical protein